MKGPHYWSITKVILLYGLSAIDICSLKVLQAFLLDSTVDIESPSSVESRCAKSCPGHRPVCVTVTVTVYSK